ncbi:MAG: exodeoxyribonuclease VII small subunit [Actinobacteria bacterium]|nr:exodeoxyribonuclease VII small subunit [Actinomycetota bacterium]
MTSEPETFSEAMGELQAILADIESDDVDVDRLAANVRRAAALISLCRQRIGAVEMEVEQIVAELDSGDSPS